MLRRLNDRRCGRKVDFRPVAPILLSLIEPYLVRSPGGYWLSAIIFGAIFPTTVAWFIVRPLKGLPAADVFRVPGIFIGPIANGLWGLGTALFLSWMPGPAAGAQ